MEATKEQGFEDAMEAIVMLKVARQNIKMSVKDLAFQLGIPIFNIYRMEEAKRDVHLSTFFRYLRALNLDIEIIPIGGDWDAVMPPPPPEEPSQPWQDPATSASSTVTTAAST